MDATAQPVTGKRILIRRHSLTVRLSHWLNVLCMTVLLFSGLQIFNAHPALYWGQYGADDDPAFIAMDAVQDGDRVKGMTASATSPSRRPVSWACPMSMGSQRPAAFPPG